MINKDVQRCFEKICENFGVVAGLNMTELLRSCEQADVYVAFIDMHTASHFSFTSLEILKNINKDGIKSKKDYRRLRGLVRMRIIDSIRSIQDLTDDSLRRLGVNQRLCTEE